MRAHLKPVEDQTVVITGATSDIGLATTRRGVARSARLVLTARSADAFEEARAAAVLTWAARGT